MSDTNITKHPDMVHIGPATLCLYDEIDDLLVNIGKVDNIRLAKTVELATLKEIVSGVEVETRGQPINEQYRLRGLLTETLDPNTQRLVMKNCGTPTVTATCTIGAVTEEVQVFQDVQHILKYNNGFYGTGILPGAQLVVGTAFGTGGTIATGTYVFVVVPNYDGTRGATISSADVAVTLGENVALVITHPAGVTPTSWYVYVYDTDLAETIVDADLIAELPAFTVASTSTVFSSWTRTTDYPGEAVGAFVVTDDTGLIEYAVGTDYTIDSSCAMFCLVDGGGISDGEWVLITYSYYKNPVVEMTIGPSNHLPKYVHPVILAFKDDDRDTPVGKGVEIHLYKVMANSGWEWDLSALNYESGFEFEWTVLFDRRYMHHGHIYTFHRQFSSFGLKDFADLTQWTNEENCVVPTS